MERCPGCGFEMLRVATTEYDESAAMVAGERIVALVPDVVALLDRAGDQGVRTRPQPATWSPLEYACHLRDVLLVQRERVLLARRATRPEMTPMGRDERVAHDGYAEQSPVAVGRQLADAASLFAGVLARLDPADWDRIVMYTYPERRERTLRWMAVHTLHEVVHHLDDIARQVRSPS